MNLAFEKINIYHDGGEKPFEPGKVIIERLEKGFARTIGNTLRRILLNAMPGASVIGIKIPGINHQFTSIPGTPIDVVELIYNLKEIRFSLEKEKVYVAKFETTKSGIFTAGDLDLPKGVKVMNTEQELIKTNGSQKVEFELYIKMGRGYIEDSEHKDFEGEEGIITVDGVFTPIVSVGYHEEPMRVGDNPNYEKLVLDILTDGSITPKDAVMVAAKIANSHFNFFENMSDIAEKIELYKEQEEEENRILDLTIQELDLSVRSYNCLEREGYLTVRQIITLSQQELASINQLGERSVKEIVAIVHELGLDLRRD